ncbi:MAG: acetyl-CoA carboxylase biotin carboxyl carrier protein [Roseivirga sp.]|jgi:acetyl-CoA carboxylase biotin carboxyl carrier protein
MDLKEIQNLIKFVARSGAAEVNLETEDFKIVIKTESAMIQEHQPTQVISMPQQAAAPVMQAAATAATPAAPASADNTEASTDDSKYVTVKSPMIGTFYRRPSPDKELFVNVGDEVNEGTVVCVIEAMKLFNEIESEVSGKIVKILVDDQSPVEYDQPLYLVDPS